MRDDGRHCEAKKEVRRRRRGRKSEAWNCQNKPCELPVREVIWPKKFLIKKWSKRLRVAAPLYTTPTQQWWQCTPHLTPLPTFLLLLFGCGCCTSSMTVSANLSNAVPQQEILVEPHKEAIVPSDIVPAENVQKPSKPKKIQFYRGTLSSPFAMEMLDKMVQIPLFLFLLLFSSLAL